jgi:hypothetical protein
VRCQKSGIKGKGRESRIKDYGATGIGQRGMSKE